MNLSNTVPANPVFIFIAQLYPVSKRATEYYAGIAVNIKNYQWYLAVRISQKGCLSLPGIHIGHQY